MKSIKVAAEHMYEVHVGTNILDNVAKQISEKVNQVAVIFAPAVKSLALDMVSQIQTTKPEIAVHLIAAPDSEAAKTFDFVEVAHNLLGELKFTRSDLVISVGGGATTDVAGFIAATWLRGIDIIHIPTTLLAMVDAAVGGKTGINTKAGKNLVGAFHNPVSVWCDVAFLETLPESDLRAGFAEVIKCGFISDQKIIELIEKSPKDVFEKSVICQFIERAVAVKAKVVAADFKENQSGGLGREILNYGHTFGHAIEKIENYSWRHGDAISVGMMFVAHLSNRTGHCSAEFVHKQKQLLETIGLPISYNGDFDSLVDAMRIDKKARGNTLRFIGLSDFGKPIIINAPDIADLEWCYEQIAGGK
ncbi:MAG: hypothetical protein RLZZ330_780 [Actinomycetota bacterium]|jgi:3-dehydroquinate synthase